MVVGHTTVVVVGRSAGMVVVVLSTAVVVVLSTVVEVLVVCASAPVAVKAMRPIANNAMITPITSQIIPGSSVPACLFMVTEGRYPRRTAVRRTCADTSVNNSQTLPSG